MPAYVLCLQRHPHQTWISLQGMHPSFMWNSFWPFWILLLVLVNWQVALQKYLRGGGGTNTTPNKCGQAVLVSPQTVQTKTGKDRHEKVTFNLRGQASRSPRGLFWFPDLASILPKAESPELLVSYIVGLHGIWCKWFLTSQLCVEWNLLPGELPRCSKWIHS